MKKLIAKLFPIEYAISSITKAIKHLEFLAEQHKKDAEKHRQQMAASAMNMKAALEESDRAKRIMAKLSDLTS